MALAQLAFCGILGLSAALTHSLDPLGLLTFGHGPGQGCCGLPDPSRWVGLKVLVSHPMDGWGGGGGDIILGRERACVTPWALLQDCLVLEACYGCQNVIWYIKYFTLPSFLLP